MPQKENGYHLKLTPSLQGEMTNERKCMKSKVCEKGFSAVLTSL